MRIQAGMEVLAFVLLGALTTGAPLHGLPQTASATHAPPPAEMRVDINRATMDELLKVPGMTNTWAGRIVRFRPYRTKQDLVDRGVVNSEVYARIKDHIIAHREKQ